MTRTAGWCAMAAPGRRWTLGARRVPVSRPRARTTDGQEVGLGTFAAFAADGLLGQVVPERMLAGLACRRFSDAQEPVGAAVAAEARLDVALDGVPPVCEGHRDRCSPSCCPGTLSGVSVAALMVDGCTSPSICWSSPWRRQPTVRRCDPVPATGRRA